MYVQLLAINMHEVGRLRLETNCYVVSEFVCAYMCMCECMCIMYIYVCMCVLYVQMREEKVCTYARTHLQLNFYFKHEKNLVYFMGEYV